MAASNKANMHQSTQLVLDQQHQVLPDHHHQYHHHHHQQMSYGMMMQPIISSSTTLNPSVNFMYVYKFFLSFSIPTKEYIVVCTCSFVFDLSFFVFVIWCGWAGAKMVEVELVMNLVNLIKPFFFILTDMIPPPRSKIKDVSTEIPLISIWSDQMNNIYLSLPF